MKKFSVIALLALLVMAGLSSCKYEDGPFISFIPKVERVANTWIVGQEFMNDTLITGTNSLDQITLYKEGNCGLISSWWGGTITYNGTWAFTDDKAAITIAVVDGTGFLSINETYTILRLKEKELWVQFTDDNGDRWETHFIPKSA